ncbi:MAG: hypothetical protein ACJAZB_001445 [Psychrosphaera sp.]|jgi:hypothetical protein
MKSLCITLFTLILTGCDDRLSSSGDGSNLTILTTDIAGKRLPINRVYWVYDSEPNVLHELECKTELCDSWYLPVEIEGNIAVFAENAVPFDNDPYCAEVYSGEKSILIDKNQAQTITIEVKYSDSLCQ